MNTQQDNDVTSYKDNATSWSPTIPSVLVELGDEDVESNKDAHETQ